MLLLQLTHTRLDQLRARFRESHHGQIDPNNPGRATPGDRPQPFDEDESWAGELVASDDQEPHTRNQLRGHSASVSDRHHLRGSTRAIRLPFTPVDEFRWCDCRFLGGGGTRLGITRGLA